MKQKDWNNPEAENRDGGGARGGWRTVGETGLLVYVGCGLSQLENFDHFNLLYPALLLSLSSTFIKPCKAVLIFLFSAQDKKTES